MDSKNWLASSVALSIMSSKHLKEPEQPKGEKVADDGESIPTAVAVYLVTAYYAYGNDPFFASIPALKTPVVSKMLLMNWLRVVDPHYASLDVINSVYKSLDERGFLASRNPVALNDAGCAILMNALNAPGVSKDIRSIRSLMRQNAVPMKDQLEAFIEIYFNQKTEVMQQPEDDLENSHE